MLNAIFFKSLYNKAKYLVTSWLFPSKPTVVVYRGKIRKSENICKQFKSLRTWMYNSRLLFKSNGTEKQKNCVDTELFWLYLWSSLANNLTGRTMKKPGFKSLSPLSTMLVWPCDWLRWHFSGQNIPCFPATMESCKKKSAHNLLSLHGYGLPSHDHKLYV